MTPAWRTLAAAVLVLLVGCVAWAQPQPPMLTAPVNDFAGVIDPQVGARMERQIRDLQRTTGDVVVVATVETVQPDAIETYAVRMFENHGRGIGGRRTDAGVLVLVAVKDRQAHIEVGYGLEEFITDGFAGETVRSMLPSFREGRYGEGLTLGVSRLVARIARARQVNVDSSPAPGDNGLRRSVNWQWLIWIFLMFVIWAMRTSRRTRRSGRWGAGPWSGWHSGVGPFGGGSGGFGGGFGGFGGGGGGGGGGFGGFGGGRSGGGGATGGW